MKKQTFYLTLKYALLIVSCGFYTLPVSAWEAPGHPKSAEELQQEERQRERDQEPMRELEDENQREYNDKYPERGGWAKKE